MNAQKIEVTPDIVLESITENIWIHITYTDYPGWGRISANGLLIKEQDHVVLIDTPWNNEHTEILYNWVEDNWNLSITKVIVSHYHTDNLGGLEFLHLQGVISYAYSKTIEICTQQRLPVPQKTFDSEFILGLAPVKIKGYFPGEGHTVDSIVIYLPDYKILFGGCSVKSLDSKTPGNISEANLNAWPDTLRLIKEKYYQTEIVVPGHGRPGDLSLIEHTLALF